jgi:TATA-box binding protein (TBP) (component of TFIID and TFIIIB)
MSVNYQKFESIDVSTMTIIGITNWGLNIERLYEKLPITDYVIIPKKRGRKKKEVREDPNKDISEGSIITLKYEDKIRGVNLKQKKVQGKKGYFRNSMTVVMSIDKKLINFKISKNGKFQITGCKRDEHAEKCVKYIYEYIQKINDNQICKLNNGDSPEVTFITMMTNIDFNLGFNVNREALDEHINKNTPYDSILETSFGYTGVNIKIPHNKSIGDPILKKISFVDNNWIYSQLTYDAYISTLPPKDQKKEMQKTRRNTFLVFQSGNVILSCKHHYYMKDMYEKFIDIVNENRAIFEERVL